MSASLLDVTALREAVDRSAAVGERLRRASDDEVVRSLAATFDAVASPTSVLGREARKLLPESTRLSLPMIEWALTASLSRITASRLTELLDRARGTAPGHILVPARAAVTVLSANVFTACVEPIVFALLARVPLVLKASSRDDVLPRLISLALRDAAPELGDVLHVVTFQGGDREREDILFRNADFVSAYGHDYTLADIRARLPATTTFVPHGSGLGIAIVGRETLVSEPTARAAAQACAMDVATYDQRGCLSPHAIMVERGGAIDHAVFARWLAEALEGLEATLPRGPLATDEGAAQMQWRGVSVARGKLLEGDGYAVALDPAGPLRLSPGFRNVSVSAVEGVPQALALCAPFGIHLKAIGAGDPGTIGALLGPGLSPRLSSLGRMQSPPLDELADGASQWHGLLRPLAL